MSDQRFDPDYRFMKWGLFTVLFLTAPAPVIVFQSFMTGPLIFLAASVLTMTAEQWVPGNTMTWALIGYFTLHLMLFAGIYLLAAMAAARLISLIPGSRARAATIAAAAMGALLVALLPAYGGAGIHGGRWGPLTRFFETLNGSHFGPLAAIKIYGPFAVFLGAGYLYRKLRRRGDHGGP